VEKLGEIVAATNYKRKMHSRLKFLAYLHLICASSIFWPEFSAAQQQQQQQAASLTEKIPLGESQKRRQRIPRILPLLPKKGAGEIVTYTALVDGIGHCCCGHIHSTSAVCDSRNGFLSFLPWLVREIGYG